MTRLVQRSIVAGSLAVLALGTAGCLCPPCPTAAAGGAPATAATAGNGRAAAGPVATGSRLAVWDGEGAGAGAQGWDSCADPKTGCSKVGTAPGVGINNSNAIKLHGDGTGFLGMGWNLFGWYPANAGIDMTPYSHLTFQIRVDAKSPEVAVDPASVGVLLGCSGNKNDSATVPVERYAKGFADGKWHKVEIPISAFTKGPGAKFDPQSFWEFRIATWSAAPRHFDIFIDDIALEKQ
ncbi:MAG TPA: hypothetical protein VH853_16340 [Polyangia bacterium]|jgi:hypothetical protein|nr:hypothetical protein [Polyangia bacterium]